MLLCRNWLMENIIISRINLWKVDSGSMWICSCSEFPQTFLQFSSLNESQIFSIYCNILQRRPNIQTIFVYNNPAPDNSGITGNIHTCIQVIRYLWVFTSYISWVMSANYPVLTLLETEMGQSYLLLPSPM